MWTMAVGSLLGSMRVKVLVSMIFMGVDQQIDLAIEEFANRMDSKPNQN
jgi:hypothetical protein